MKPSAALRTQLAVTFALTMALSSVARAADAPAPPVDPLTPYGRIGYYVDSNVFALPTAGPQLPPGTNTAISDHYAEALAGVELVELYGRQKLSVTLEGRHFDYDRLSYLNHFEYLGLGSFDWQLGNSLDGNLRYREEQKMTPFMDQYTTVLILQTERIASANVRLTLTPDWSIKPQVMRRDLEYPQPLYPDERLREDTAGAVLAYAGLGPVRLGIEFEHLTGVYSGVDNTIPKVSQEQYNLTADYAVTALSTFDGSIGYTSRDQGGTAGNLSAVTGSVAYRRNLTGKTTFSLLLQRAINSYVTAGSSELDTGGTLQLDWQATRRVLLSVAYTHTNSNFDGYLLAGVGAEPGRRDHYDTGRFTLRWDALHWLSIQPHVSYQKRESNQVLYTFDESIVGIDLVARANNNL